MLIPGSVSAFASCMWVSIEMTQGEPNLRNRKPHGFLINGIAGVPIAAFSKIVELALPYWDLVREPRPRRVPLTRRGRSARTRRSRGVGGARVLGEAPRTLDLRAQRARQVSRPQRVRRRTRRGCLQDGSGARRGGAAAGACAAQEEDVGRRLGRRGSQRYGRAAESPHQGTVDCRGGTPNYRNRGRS